MVIFGKWGQFTLISGTRVAANDGTAAKDLQIADEEFRLILIRKPAAAD